MATQEQIRPVSELEAEKQAKLDAIVDKAVDILSPWLDSLPEDEEAAFLEKLANLPKPSADTRRTA